MPHMINCMQLILIKEKIGLDWIWTLEIQEVSEFLLIVIKANCARIGQYISKEQHCALETWPRQVSSSITNALWWGTWGGSLDLHLTSKLTWGEVNNFTKLIEKNNHIYLTVQFVY